MLILFGVLAFYLVLGSLAVSAAWFAIGRKGFTGLEQTDSRLAKLFGRGRVASNRTVLSMPIAGNVMNFEEQSSTFAYSVAPIVPMAVQNPAA